MSSQRRDAQQGSGGSRGDGVLRYVGAAGAIGGAVALAARLVMNDDYFRGENLLGGGRDGYPAAIRNQIRARHTPQPVDGNDESLTLEDLEILAAQYTEELNSNTVQGNWDRVSWLGETQKLVKSIMDMQRTLGRATQEANYAMVVELTPKVRNAQQELLRRRRQDGDVDEEELAPPEPSSQSTTASYSEQKDYDEEMSREEIKDRIKSIESVMENIDVSSPDDVSTWRALKAEREVYLEKMRTMKEASPVPTTTPQNRSFLDGIFLRPTAGPIEALSASTRKKRASGKRASRKRKSSLPVATSRKAAKTKRNAGRPPKHTSDETAIANINQDASPYRPDWDHRCPTVIEWEVDPEAPTTKDDLSDAAMAFTAPNGCTDVPQRKLPGFAGLNEELIKEFVESARSDQARSSENLLYLLPDGCDLDEAQTRHLFRNFSDEIISDPSSNSVRLTRREFDIMVFCKSRTDLGIQACHKLMSYRDAEDVQDMWEYMFKRNGKDINVDSEMSCNFKDHLRGKIGLLAQLEGLVGAIQTSRGRAVLPPPNFAADTYEPRSSKETSTSDVPGGSKSVKVASEESPTRSTANKSSHTGEKDSIQELVVVSDPTFPDDAEFTAGTLVLDRDCRLFYIAIDNETPAKIMDKLSSDSNEVVGATNIDQPLDLEALIAANSARYSKRFPLTATSRLRQGTLLVLPPHEWPTCSAGDDASNDKDGEDDKQCDVCGSSADETTLLLCDDGTCSIARHTMCCNPPLSRVPEGQWYCSDECRQVNMTEA